MFSSCGLFADMNCPFSNRGPCERPHCLYKHATEVRDIFGASFKSSTVAFAGVQSGYPVNDDTKDDSFQELERINKEIETVRHEVEQEQRRLSHYQTVQADCGNFSVSKSGKNTDRGPYELSSCIDLTKTYSRARKYVVDNSKPRTDLEYDPLSNFSAGLLSYSSGKDEKVKNEQGLKRARTNVSYDQKEPVDDLIIDITPSPEKKRVKAKKPVDSVFGKSSQEKMEVLVEEPVVILNANVGKVPTSTAPMMEGNINSSLGTENNHVPFDPHENEEYENIPVNRSVVDLTSCSEDLQSETSFQAETEVEKSPESSSPSATTVQQGHNRDNLVAEKVDNAFQIELPHSVKKMNPVQPHHFPPQHSLSYKASDSPCRQHNKLESAAQPAEMKAAATCVPSVLPYSQNASSKMPGPMQSKATASESYQEPAGPGSDSSQGQTLHDSSASSLANRAESSASAKHLLMSEDDEEVILISSSSGDEDELNYSEIDLSDSDPMEECYRIFMEANNNDKGNEVQPEEPVEAMDVEKPKLTNPQALPGKKRVAHEAKHIEQPVAKSRPQPQVLVPLRGPAVLGFSSQPSITSKIQQQRASMLTASVKGGQAFVSSASQRKSETQSAPLASTQTPENLQPALVQNAYMNCISVGTAVIGVGNNLHLILPEGTFPLPVTSSSSQVTSVLTPISPVQTSSVTVRQIYHSPAVPPVQRYRTTAPVLISAPARKLSQTSAFSSAHSSPAVSSTPQPAVHSTVKPVPTKRKLKQKGDAAKDKVPHDIRQRYVNIFTEEFLKTTADVNDAFEKALAEEKSVYNRSANKLKYLSVAVNALKKLKNQSAAAARGENQVNSQKSKGNISLNLKKFKADDIPLYESLKDYILTEEMLAENNYPVQHPEKSGCAVLFVDNKKSSTDPLKRICCRCGATYSVNQMGKHTRKEECNYHYGKGVTKKVPGGVETRYSCCEGVMGAPGCQAFHLHVHDSLSLDGFVSTVPRHLSDTSCPGVYSLDCEMCYTIRGLELSRVTVVNSSLQVIYDTFVRPDSEVIDYNTRFSGISEEDVKGIRVSLREVQETLLSFISTDTILIGHGLETDLCALKLLHGMVVDTSVVFPHRLGPPHKLTLKNLTAEYLRRIIQESVCGHDTAEDAAAGMELMLWKVKEDGKLRK